MWSGNTSTQKQTAPIFIDSHQLVGKEKDANIFFGSPNRTSNQFTGWKSFGGFVIWVQTTCQRLSAAVYYPLTYAKHNSIRIEISVRLVAAAMAAHVHTHTQHTHIPVSEYQSGVSSGRSGCVVTGHFIKRISHHFFGPHLDMNIFINHCKTTWMFMPIVVDCHAARTQHNHERRRRRRPNTHVLRPSHTS